MSGAEAAVVRELAAAATQLGDMQGALRLALQRGPIGLQGEAGAVQPVERIVEKVVEVEKIVEVAGAAEVAGKMEARTATATAAEAAEEAAVEAASKAAVEAAEEAAAWPIEPTAVAQFCTMFAEACAAQGAGVDRLGKAQAGAVLTSSGLPTQVLLQIWALADIDGDDQLNLQE